MRSRCREDRVDPAGRWKISHPRTDSQSVGRLLKSLPRLVVYVKHGQLSGQERERLAEVGQLREQVPYRGWVTTERDKPEMTLAPLFLDLGI